MPPGNITIAPVWVDVATVVTGLAAVVGIGLAWFATKVAHENLLRVERDSLAAKANVTAEALLRLDDLRAQYSAILSELKEQTMNEESTGNLSSQCFRLHDALDSQARVVTLHIAALTAGHEDDLGDTFAGELRAWLSNLKELFLPLYFYSWMSEHDLEFDVVAGLILDNARVDDCESFNRFIERYVAWSQNRGDNASTALNNLVAIGYGRVHRCVHDLLTEVFRATSPQIPGLFESRILLPHVASTDDEFPG